MILLNTNKYIIYNKNNFKYYKLYKIKYNNHKMKYKKNKQKKNRMN